MSNLTRDQLRAVAKAATGALRAGIELYAPPGEDTTKIVAYVTGAQVSAVVEALEAGGYRLTRLDSIGPAPDRIVANGPSLAVTRDGFDNEKGFFPYFTPEEVAAMPDPAPFPAPEPPAPEVADDAPDSESHPPWTPKQNALYVRLAPALQRMAREGYMPTKAEYNAQRGDLPVYAYLLWLLNCKWSDLAAKLGLQVQSRYRGPGKGAKQEEPEPDGNPLGAAVPRLRGTAIVNANGLVERVEVAPTAPILHRAPDGGVTRIVPRADGSQARSLPSAYAERNADGRAVKPAYSTEE